MSHEKLTLTASDGATLTLYHWAPSGAARATVQIAHGMAEHGARYGRLGELLAAEGFAVYANDHRGHGPDIPTTDLGWFGEDGWRRVSTDLHEIGRFIAERHPDVRRGLMGHSMGSFMALTYLRRYSRDIDAAVLSGSNVGGGPLVAAGRWVAKLECLRQGPRGQSGLIHFLSFGSFNNDFKPPRTDFDWLSRDEAEVDEYVADPLCGFRCSNLLWADFLGGLNELGSISNLAQIRSDLPFYVFSGDRDPVGESGKGVPKLVSQLRRSGLQDVTQRMYRDGRHEMLNETNRDEVMDELRAWLCAKLLDKTG